MPAFSVKMDSHSAPGISLVTSPGKEFYYMTNPHIPVASLYAPGAQDQRIDKRRRVKTFGYVEMMET